MLAEQKTWVCVIFVTHDSYLQIEALVTKNFLAFSEKCLFRDGCSSVLYALRFSSKTSDQPTAGQLGLLYDLVKSSISNVSTFDYFHWNNDSEYMTNSGLPDVADGSSTQYWWRRLQLPVRSFHEKKKNVDSFEPWQSKPWESLKINFH